jgi:glycine/D-amino acid oxidase-like deaminating enzyme
VAFQDSIPPTDRRGIRFSNQAKFHPIKYLRALAAQAAQAGVQMFENAGVDAFEEKPSRAVVGDFSITYDQVVIATHMPLQGNVGTVSALLFRQPP